MERQPKGTEILFVSFAFVLSLAALSCTSGTVQGDCTPRCDENQCQECVDHACQNRCQGSEVCSNGSCEVPTCDPPCDNAQCQECVNQTCQSRCQGTEECKNGSCQVPTCDPPCDNAQCQECVDQSCQSRCQGTKVCNNGTCKEPLVLPPGFQFYPSDHIWNTPVDTLPAHPMSDAYISSSRPSYFMFVGAVFPYNVVDDTQEKQYLTSTTHPEYSDDIPYPIPDNPAIEDSGGDHHLLIVDRDSNIEYELYQPVQAEDGTWSAFCAMKFDLSDYSLRTDGYPSTDAAGLAVLPGIIRYVDVEAQEINHAMRVAMYTSGDKHTWPARADGNENDPSYPPFGQRFRLKASFNTAGYSPHAKTILEAWKKYGFMLADNSLDPRAWIIAADTDPRWEDSSALFDELLTVHGSDFEAVDVSSLMIDKDSGQARTP
jgi:hypothetical protein